MVALRSNSPSPPLLTIKQLIASFPLPDFTQLRSFAVHICKGPPSRLSGGWGVYSCHTALRLARRCDACLRC